ncbi:MAG: PKD domain-containing protein [Bacteroidota bacterium]|nr:PKD domain-containing protein [Bacteroidota bacterium]
MKKFLLIFILSLSCFVSFANHTKGGWMYYEYLGPGINDPTKLRYKIVLKFYMICNPTPQQLDPQINFSYFDGGGTHAFIENESVGLTENPNISNCSTAQCNPCILNVPSICYKIATYSTIRELAPSPDGYIIAAQRCCRITGIVNIINSNTVGDTWTISIPGTNISPTAPINSSPQFIPNDTAIVCADNYFKFNFTAVDPDNDSLVYSFAPAYDGGSSGNPSPITAILPFASVPYANPFSASQPLGAGVTIDPKSGIVSGIAPSSGIYVLTAVAKEYRNGVYIGEARKSLHLQVADCFPIRATLNPQYITCDGFSLTFSNETPNSSIQTYNWSFGDTASGASNVSSAANPTHTFSDTGTYKIKLVVNKGLACADSTISLVKVYPGFFPGFKFIGNCINSPIQFIDTSKTNYGTINSWSWNFGDGTTISDTSHLQNPTYTYAATGNFNVILTVSNSKGCTKTVSTTNVPIISNPVITTLFKDSAYCGKDTIQLLSSTNVTGSYNWTPNNNIINPNSANPLVFPSVPTKYVVTFDAGGCHNSDSITVTPKFDLAAGISVSNANICEEDTITLSATGNHTPLNYTWSPANTVSSPNSSITKAFPANNTNYSVQVLWGNHCVTSANTNITVKKLAIPNAGPDTFVCKNSSGVLLNATGGDNYVWRPSTGLSNPNIANPIANPSITTSYIVSAGVNGCSKRREDTVVVINRDLPVISLTNDTLICAIDTLQLYSASPGATQFLWTPNYRINNQNIASPKVSPQIPTTYFIQITDGYQCVNKDSVKVDVKQFVSINAGNDTTICQGDAVQLQPISDALHYKWSPTATLDYDTLKSPTATPLNNTTYQVIGNIGKCQNSDNITIQVAPYPKAYAGKDVTICFDSSTVLNASGGSIYLWTPSFYLSDPNIANPIANPPSTIRYIVSVSDTLGCTKSANDTVLVIVSPKLIANAGNDTSIVVNQPLQLNASGGQTYLWSPATGLNNINIANPVAILQNNQQYVLKVSNDAGCSEKDTINITVYKVDAGLYIPNAFTPNGDGINDVFKPVTLGIKSLTYFRIFNRFGEKVFSTSQQNVGWDGTYKGKPMDQDVFVWIAEGIDYQNNKISKRGTVMLIR